VYFEDNAQVEIINIEGTRILIDIYDPSRLSKPANEKDILLTTHTHSDHTNPDFLKSFTGRQLYLSTGTLDMPGVHITGIMSGHNEGDSMAPKDGSNYLFLVETDGLRIVHFGDIGQDALNDEQLKALGRIDVAITQFSNQYSGMDAINGKGINLMDQAQPLMIIPTHNSLDVMRTAMKKWAGLAVDNPFVSIRRENLPVKTTLVFMGSTAPSFKKIFKLDSVIE